MPVLLQEQAVLIEHVLKLVLLMPIILMAKSALVSESRIGLVLTAGQLYGQ